MGGRCSLKEGEERGRGASRRRERQEEDWEEWIY
jgi:hypothetical protein